MVVWGEGEEEEVDVVAGEVDTAIVEAFAIPRKWWRVDGRGKAVGLRNERDIEDGECVNTITNSICLTSPAL